MNGRYGGEGALSPRRPRGRRRGSTSPGSSRSSPRTRSTSGSPRQWNVWDWGATHGRVTEAQHDGRARRARPRTRWPIRSRATSASTGSRPRPSSTAWRSRSQQQETAEEAYRLQKVKLDNCGGDHHRRARRRDRCRARAARGGHRALRLLPRARRARALGRRPAEPEVIPRRSPAPVADQRSSCSSRTSSPTDHAWNGAPAA